MRLRSKRQPLEIPPWESEEKKRISFRFQEQFIARYEIKTVAFFFKSCKKYDLLPQPRIAVSFNILGIYRPLYLSSKYRSAVEHTPRDKEVIGSNPSRARALQLLQSFQLCGFAQALRKGEWFIFLKINGCLATQNKHTIALHLRQAVS